MKEKEYNDLLNCQMINCYNDTLNTLKIHIESILAHTKKTTEEYKLASKYKKIIAQMAKKTKLTGEDIKRFNNDLVKIILKEHKYPQYR
jgi:polyhydroxyalkanoate synthesis regulator phasin